MTKAETDLGKSIAKKHYVELTTKAKQDAAEKLAKRELVRIYEKDGKLWAKALTRKAFDTMAAL